MPFDTPQTTGKWPMFHHDPAHTGRQPTATGPTPPVDIAWRRPAETPAFAAAIYGSPAISDSTLFYGRNKSHVYAVNITDGTEQWRFTHPTVGSDTKLGPAWGAPAVSDDTVYIGAHTGNLYALDIATGTRRWYTDLTVAQQSSPTLHHDTLYTGSLDDSLYAIDTATGATQWVFQTGDSVNSSPAVTDTMVYAGSNDGHLYAIATADGTEQWRVTTDDNVLSDPTIADDTVYVGGGDLFEPQHNQQLYALDRATGDIQWAFEADGHIRTFDYSPAIADDLVIATTAVTRTAHGTYVYALDAATGAEQWRFHVDSVHMGHPIVGTDVVYVVSDTLYALDVATGDPRWTLPATELCPEQWSASFTHSPVLNDETLFVTANGALCALQ